MFKKISIYCIYVSLFLLLINCSAVKTRSFDDRIVYSGFKVESANRPWSIERESKIVRAGKGSLKFELRPTDRWSYDSSFRSELREIYQPSAKQDIWYGFSIYVPEQQGTKRQYITLAQFHDPGPYHPAKPPNLRIYLNNDEMFVNICWKSKKDTSWLPKEYKRSISKNIGVTIANKGFKIKAFEFNKWLDFVINAKWSADNDGYINIWLNDEKTVQYSGPNLYGNYLTPYFKFGIYLSAGANRHIITYFDEYRRGKSYNEVNPVQTSE